MRTSANRGMASVCHRANRCLFQGLLQALSQALSQALCFIVSLSQVQRVLLFIVDLTADLCSFHRLFGTMCDHAYGCIRTVRHRTS